MKFKCWFCPEECELYQNEQGTFSGQKCQIIKIVPREQLKEDICNFFGTINMDLNPDIKFNFSCRLREKIKLWHTLGYDNEPLKTQYDFFDLI